MGKHMHKRREAPDSAGAPLDRGLPGCQPRKAEALDLSSQGPKDKPVLCVAQHPRLSIRVRDAPRAGAQAAAELVADLAFRRRVQLFWPLGSRLTAELLAEIAAKHGCRIEIERFLDRAVAHEDT